MCAGTQSTQEQKKLNTRERKGQDATKITSASRRFMHPTSLLSDADFDDSADMDGEKHSQSEHHRGFHRGDR